MDVALALYGLEKHRGDMTNEEWGNEIETVSDSVTKAALGEFTEGFGYEVTLLTMPYSANSTRIGDGKDSTKTMKIGNGPRKVACFYDTIDGTWNAKAGIPYTVSSLCAFTGEIDGKVPEKFSFEDFSIGVVAPHQFPGLYYGERGVAPFFKRYNDGKEEPLKMTEETDPGKTRCIIDIFTTQTKEAHDRALKAVVPVMRKWRDYGRLYGTGVELMSLLGRNNTTPGFGGYVTAQQKTDNLVAGLIILEQAGAIISDWDGKSLDARKLDERVEVAIGANKELHDVLISDLKGKKVA